MIQLVRQGKLPEMKALIDAGESHADAQMGLSGLRAIHVASEFGHVEIVRVLLALGAKPNVLSAATKPPLHLAARNGHTEVIKLLLAAGADPTKAVEGRTALTCAANGEIAKLLRESKNEWVAAQQS